MLGAPPGFIPMLNGDIVNARSIDSVAKLTMDQVTVSHVKSFQWDEKYFPKLDFDKEIICVDCRGVKYYMNMSVQQFAARIIEAMNETQPKGNSND